MWLKPNTIFIFYPLAKANGNRTGIFYTFKNLLPSDLSDGFWAMI